MKPTDFVKKVESKEIPNGTKFSIYENQNIIGKVLVKDKNIVFLDIIDIPVDLLENDEKYKFIEIGEN